MNKVEKAIIERKVEDLVSDVFDETTARVMKGVNKLASLQGGETMVENYKLLGKRTLIVIGGVIVVANLATTIVGHYLSRKNEEKRVEKIVRRVLDEEREKEAAEAEDCAI